jgi:hypothetical protein
MNESSNDKMSSKEKKEFSNIAKNVFRTICSQYIEMGLMKSDYLEFSELEKDFWKIVKSWKFEESVIDHTDNIEEEGKRYLNNKQYMLACIVYSVWTEHFINGFIHKICIRNKINEACFIGLIRKCNIEDKCSWIMELIKGPKLNDRYRMSILKMNNYRNYFIHYKWQPTKDDFNLQIIDIICAYPKTISYLKRIESYYLYNGNKNKVTRLIGKKRKKNS